MNADGSGQTDITNSPLEYEAYPDWSPDGTRIAFSRSEAGDYDVWTMDPTGPIRPT